MRLQVAFFSILAGMITSGTELFSKIPDPPPQPIRSVVFVTLEHAAQSLSPIARSGP